MRAGRKLRIEEEKRQQVRREEARRRQELEELAHKIQVEEAKIKELEDSANNWVRANRIRDYLVAIELATKNKDKSSTSENPQEQWVEWARQQADRLDPLVESPPSILDRKDELRRR